MPRMPRDRDAQQLAPPGVARDGAAASGRLRGAHLDRARLLLQERSRSRGRSSSCRSRARRPPRGSTPRARRRTASPSSTWVRRWAAPEESRSIRRNQWRLAEVVAQPAEGEQAVVGVGAVGEPLEHHRQQVALDRRPRDTPAVSAAMCRRAPAGSVKPIAASRRGACSLLSASPLLGQSAATADEQRPVEEALVEAAHLASWCDSHCAQILLAGVARPLARARTRRSSGSRRHEVGAAQVARAARGARAGAGPGSRAENSAASLAADVALLGRGRRGRAALPRWRSRRRTARARAAAAGR